MSEPKPCLCEGCTNLRHATNNPYCKVCRAAYQKALRMNRSGSYVNDPDEQTGSVHKGRPFRPVDAKVLYFMKRINGKEAE